MQTSTTTLQKKYNDKFAWCSGCETLKCFWDAHTIRTESYITH